MSVKPERSEGECEQKGDASESESMGEAQGREADEGVEKKRE